MSTTVPLPPTLIRKILCPVDFSATSADALRFAAALNSGSEIIVLHVYLFQPPPYPDEEQVEARAVDRRDWQAVAETNLKKFVRTAVGHLSPRTDTVVVQGLATSAISHAAATFHPDVIVMGRHDRAGSGRSLLGSVAERALQAIATPILMVPPGYPISRDGCLVREILCPVNNTLLAYDSLRFAAAVATGYRAPLTLLRVKEEAARELVPDPCSLATSLTSLPCRVHELPGTEIAGEVLTLASAANRGLLVLGAWHRPLADWTILGDRASALVREATCPVVVVPVRGHRLPGE